VLAGGRDPVQARADAEAAEEEHGENAERALLLCGQTREQQARIRRAFRFSVLAHAAMSEGYDRFLDA